MDHAVVAKLQQQVLTWDYFDMYETGKQSDAVAETLRRPPDTFRSAQEYVQAFRPLLLDECAALLLRGGGHDRSGYKEQPPAQAGSVSTVEEDGDFTQVHLTMNQDAPSDFSDNDCVLLSQRHPESDRASESPHALAWVSRREGLTGLMLRLFLAGAAARKNSRDRLASVRTALAVVHSTWYTQPVASMSTIAREWAALHRTERIPVLHTILSGQAPTAAVRKRLAVPPGLQDVLAATFNDSQRAAITAGLQRNARLVLVQGPPGTGKTNTIRGLLSVLASAVPADSPQLLRAAGSSGSGADSSALAAPPPVSRRGLSVRASPWLVGSADGIRSLRVSATAVDSSSDGVMEDPLFGMRPGAPPQRVGSSPQRQPHLLVCAPSNGALDEIVGRLLSDKLVDARGRPYMPKLVRVGVSVHHSVESVSLEKLVAERLAKTAQAEGGGARAQRSERERIQTQLLDECDVICSTLSFAGSGIFARMARPLDAVVVDEAAQAVEPSSLIPMTLGIKQVFLVGDPNQLPATVLSSGALEHGYNTSMFQRLQAAGYPVQMLDTQYRMHPLICSFISRAFYSGALADAPGMAEKTAAPYHAAPCFGPFAFFDVRGKETVQGTSLVNRVEAELVMHIYMALTTAQPGLKDRPAIGIISPYKAQVDLLKAKFKEALGERAKNVDINTIDGFQGREKEICIFTTVRSNQRRQLGFVTDARRINVGLSRARSSLLVVGNAGALRKDQRWAGVVHYADSIGCLFQARKPFSPFLEALTADADFGTPPAAVATATGSAAPPASFDPAPEPGEYDDEDDYSDYDAMPATLQAPALAAAPVSHASIQKAQPRGKGKRKAG